MVQKGVGSMDPPWVFAALQRDFKKDSVPLIESLVAILDFTQTKNLSKKGWHWNFLHVTVDI